MSRKSMLMGLGIAAVILISVLFLIISLVRYEDADFRESSLPAGPERKAACNAFRQEVVNLTEGIHELPVWGAEFTDKQVNSYFDEGIVGTGLDETFAREGIRDPRVIFKENQVRLGFRYGSGFWSTRISVDFQVWVAPNEPNVVALELQGFHAGLLPISAQSLLERISDLVRKQNVEVSWYRHKGNPVALLRFQTDQNRAVVRLKNLTLQPGKLIVSGEAIDSRSSNSKSLTKSSDNE